MKSVLDAKRDLQGLGGTPKAELCKARPLKSVEEGYAERAPEDNPFGAISFS